MELWLPLAVEGYHLREFDEGDLERLAQLADDVEIWRWLTDLFPRPYDFEAALKWVVQQADHDPPRNLVIAGPEGLVGGVGVMLSSVPNFAHDGELGYWLGREYWGQGIMSCAVAAFMAWAAAAHGLSRFTAKVYAGNARSSAVLQRCGFAQEGVLRGAVRKDGRVLDMVVYGRVV
ncbi:MAG: GNAT family protein [Candidatus Krumholzibacteriia bacterium]